MPEEITNGLISYGVPSQKGTEKKVFYLPHQCDEWVIGNLEEADKFVADLQKTIQEMRDNLI